MAKVGEFCASNVTILLLWVAIALLVLAVLVVSMYRSQGTSTLNGGQTQKISAPAK